jgi:hypothetical protein
MFKQFIAALASCGVGIVFIACDRPPRPVDLDSRSAAIQGALDRDPALSTRVIAGEFCPASPEDPRAASEVKSYYSVAEAHVATVQRAFGPGNNRKVFH